MSYGDHVSAAPPEFTVTASTDRVPVAAFAFEAKRWYGVQFHPEVTHTRQGLALLRRFVVDTGLLRLGEGDQVMTTFADASTVHTASVCA